MGEEEELTLERMVQYGLLDELADGLLVCDSEGAVVAVNRRICELSGYSADDLVGRPVDFLVPTAARDRHRRHRAEFARSGNPTRPMGAGLDTRLLTKDGGSRGVDIALSPLIIDDRELIVAAVRDAMARRRQEHLLASMREVTEAIMKSTPAVDIHRLICEQAAEMVGAAMALIAAGPKAKTDISSKPRLVSPGRPWRGRSLPIPSRAKWVTKSGGSSRAGSVT
jgi:PAS domain S-box-containing protein